MSTKAWRQEKGHGSGFPMVLGQGLGAVTAENVGKEGWWPGGLLDAIQCILGWGEYIRMPLRSSSLVPGENEPEKGSLAAEAPVEGKDSRRRASPTSLLSSPPFPLSLLISFFPALLL